jgi:hypothetical protein
MNLIQVHTGTIATRPLAVSLAALGLSVAIAAAAGCGGGANRLRGAVSFDDVPVATGTISFEPADGKGPAVGGAIESGRYAVLSPTPGHKVVRIFATRTTGRKVESDPAPGSPLVDEIESYIPDQFNISTTLACNVAAGASTTFDFHLKSQGP